VRLSHQQLPPVRGARKTNRHGLNFDNDRRPAGSTKKVPARIRSLAQFRFPTRGVVGETGPWRAKACIHDPLQDRKPVRLSETNRGRGNNRIVGKPCCSLAQLGLHRKDGRGTIIINRHCQPLNKLIETGERVVGFIENA